jgi:hypothetical protein
MVAVLAGISFGAQGCSKNEDANKGDAKNAAVAASAAPAASGCGADYADPNKEFCVSIPPGYTAGKPSPPDELYSELIDFNGPMSGFTISVGFTSSNWKTYEDQIKSDDPSTSKDIKVESSGKTAGTGQWWVYKQGNYDTTVLATVKSNGNKAIRCSPNNTVVKPEVIEACKSLRAYPK